MKYVTQEELDWLAEGEFDPTDRQRLFDRLDQQENGWKQCALALLEQQALQASLSSIYSSTPDVLESDTSTEPTVKQPPVMNVSLANEHRRATKSYHWALLAGIAGLCFLSGYLLSSNAKQPGNDSIANLEVSPHPNQKLRDQLANNDPQMMLAVNQAVHRINVKDRELIALVSIRNNNQELLLPLIKSKMLSQRFVEMPGPSLSKDWSAQFTKAGWDLKPHREFLSLHLPDGTNQVLPVNLMNCRYVGKPIL